MFRNRVNIKISVVIDAFIYTIIITTTLISKFLENHDSIVICTFVSLLLFLYRRRKEISTPSSFAVLFLYAYNCGQAWLLFFGLKLTFGTFTITRFDNESIYYALSFFEIIICVFQFFISAFTSSDYENDSDETEIVVQDYTKSAALFCYVICLMVLLYHDLLQITASIYMGYSISGSLARDNSLVYIAINIFPLLVSVLLLSTKGFIKKFVYFHIILRSLLMMLIVGNRGQYIATLCVVYLIYTNSLPRHKRQNSRKQQTRLIVLSLFVIMIAGYVASIRNTIGENISFREYLLNHNILKEVLQELGGTLINTILVIEKCPNTLAYGMGISYLGGLVQFVPLLNRLFPNLVLYNDLGSVLNMQFERFSNSGLGGSFIAELYFNFAWLSVLIVPLFSYLIAKIDRAVSSNKISLFSKSIAYYYSYVLFMYVRSNFSDIAYYTRFLLYFWIVSEIFKCFSRHTDQLSVRNRLSHF